MEEKPAKVIITGLKVPFWDVVDLTIKLLFAAIPAAFVLGAIAFVFVALGVLGR